MRLLNGEPAQAIGARVMPASAPMFDARELRRWGIAERRLQTGAIVRFREPAPLSPWAGPVVVGITIGVLIGFAGIFALPRRTPRESSGRAIAGTNTEAALARLSQRLMQTQEVERAAIAKWIEDDVCQQLAAISMDLDARGERDLCDQVSALARESLTVSDPIYAKLWLLAAVCRAGLRGEGVRREGRRARFHRLGRAGRIFQATPRSCSSACSKKPCRTRCGTRTRPASASRCGARETSSRWTSQTRA